MTEKERFDLVVKPVAGNIVSNLADLESWVKAVTEPYIGQVVTEDQTRFAKKDLADLRKLKTALEDERRQIKEIEENARQKKEQELKDFIIKAAFESAGNKIKAIVSRPDVMSWFFDPKWLNATAARTTTERTIREKIVEVARAVNSIETAAGDDAVAALDVYYSTGSLSAAILKKTQLDEIRKAQAEVKESENAEEGPIQPAYHQPTDEPYVTPVADRIFFDIPVEPEDDVQKELMRVPAVLVFPRYKMHLLKEIMSKLGIKIMKPSSMEEE